MGYCLGVQRTGSFLVVTLGVLASIKFGINITLISLSILLIPALFISYFIKEIDLSKMTSKKINWNLAYKDKESNLSKSSNYPAYNILFISLPLHLVLMAWQ